MGVGLKLRGLKGVCQCISEHVGFEVLLKSVSAKLRSGHTSPLTLWGRAGQQGGGRTQNKSSFVLQARHAPEC